jgi:hypothetical protein
MGLDMYLSKKTYVKNWEHNGPENQHKITVKKGGKTRTDIKPERVSYITEEVGYWRKFNALHGWFVNECADGVDECQSIYVSKEKLEQLLSTLKEVKLAIDNSKKTVKVLKDWNGSDYEVETYDCEESVKELLPPTQGFFFGGYEIDDWYKQNVDETVTLIENLLEEEKESEKHGLWGGEFYYQASW